MTLHSGKQAMDTIALGDNSVRSLSTAVQQHAVTVVLSEN